jgi:hypothetical protein
MKTKAMTILLALMLLVNMLFCTPIAFAQEDTSFSMTASTSNLNIGEAFTVTINVNNANKIYAYETLISFDQSRLEIVNVESIVNGNGFRVDPKLVSDDEVLFAFTKTGDEIGESGNIGLCRYTFKAKGEGAASITLKTVELLDTNLKGDKYTINKGVTVSISKKPPSYEDEDEDEDEDEESSSGSDEDDTINGDGELVLKPKIDDNGKIVLMPKIDDNSAKGDVELKDIEDALSKVKQDADGKKTLVIEIEQAEDANEYILELPSGVISSETNTKNIELRTPIGTLTIMDNMFKAGELKEDKVQLIIRVSDSSGTDGEVKGNIGERPVIELYVKAGDRILPWNNANSPVTVQIDYEPTPEELQKHEHIVVLYIDGQGKATPVINGKYDLATGKVTFTTTHFSKYAVAFINKTFNDISDYVWAKREIEVLASRGVIKGTSIDTYSPEENIRRGDLILLLVRCLGLTAEVDSNFDDVKSGDYYYEAIGIAKELGIAKGTGNNEFKPKDFITRQDMFVLIERALRLSGKITVQGSISDLGQFKDASQVSDYAVNSMAAMVKDGLVKGDGTNLNPMQNTTRAEAAVVIYRVHNK